MVSSQSSQAQPSAQAPSEAKSSEFQGAFDRDSIPWALGRAAEQALRLAFAAPACRERYKTWIRAEAPQHGSEASLQLLGTDGCQLLARANRGEFVLVVEEPEFGVALAFVAELVEGDEQIEAVCVAHFEGDAFAAMRWARALSHKLCDRVTQQSARGALLAPWSAAAPAKC